MKIKIILLLLLILAIHSACNSNKIDRLISATYSLESVNDNLLKVIFQLRNNDTVDYFIPFIKPVSVYCKFSDSLSKNIQLDLDPNYLLTNKILTRENLNETAQLDSIMIGAKSDTMIFYFKEPFIKKCYDSILASFKDKIELRFIYPYFYHAIGNGCIYIKKNTAQDIILYVYSHYTLKPNKLIFTLNFYSKTNLFYKEKYFKHIPTKIESYLLFKGQIKINSQQVTN